MAWGDLAKVDKLLASLGELSGSNGAWSKKGAGSKGAGKSNDKDQGKGKTATKPCHWGDCKAAKGKKATWGGFPNCFCCNRPFSKAPPVEKMVDWAYLDLLKKRATGDGKAGGKTGSKGKSKGKGKGAAAKELTKEELAAKRSARLEALKTGQAPPPDPTPQPTALQQVAAVFSGDAKANAKVKVDADIVDMCKVLDAAAADALTSLQAEVYPTEQPLKKPQEILDALLAKTSTLRKDAGFGQAEAEWKTTTAVIATMQSGNADPKDEILTLMIAREEKQRKELERLREVKPSQPLRKEALLVLKAEYGKTVQAQEDSWKLGATRALNRATDRTKAIDALFAAAQILRDLNTEATKALNAAHGARTAAKRTQGTEVLDLLDVQLDELENECLQWQDAEDCLGVEPTTETEDARDEAKRLTALLEQKVLQFRQAAATAEAKVVEQQAALQRMADGQQQTSAGGDNDPEKDVWRELTPDINLLPKAEGQLGDNDQKQLDLLAAVFTAVPWGAPMPALTFHVLGAHPSIVHGLIGDHMWKEVWGEKHSRITEAHIVPYSVLEVLKLAVERWKVQPDAETIKCGKERWHEAKTEAAKRRVRNSPY